MGNDYWTWPTFDWTWKDFANYCIENGVNHMHRRTDGFPRGYKEGKTNTWQECEIECAKIAACKGFTWHEPSNHFKNSCSLYSTHNGKTEGDSTVSGRKECFDSINQLLGWGRPLSVWFLFRTSTRLGIIKYGFISRKQIGGGYIIYEYTIYYVLRNLFVSWLIGRSTQQSLFLEIFWKNLKFMCIFINDSG